MEDIGATGFLVKQHETNETKWKTSLISCHQTHQRHGKSWQSTVVSFETETSIFVTSTRSGSWHQYPTSSIRWYAVIPCNKGLSGCATGPRLWSYGTRPRPVASLVNAGPKQATVQLHAVASSQIWGTIDRVFPRMEQKCTVPVNISSSKDSNLGSVHSWHPDSKTFVFLGSCQTKNGFKWPRVLWATQQVIGVKEQRKNPLTKSSADVRYVSWVLPGASKYSMCFCWLKPRPSICTVTLPIWQTGWQVFDIKGEQSRCRLQYLKPEDFLRQCDKGL